jgi:hypothetical protein
MTRAIFTWSVQTVAFEGVKHCFSLASIFSICYFITPFYSRTAKALIKERALIIVLLTIACLAKCSTKQHQTFEFSSEIPHNYTTEGFVLAELYRNILFRGP